ncbi:MAG: tyrosine-protein phosphatase [Acetatifactor sp.]|nr:tyrosine-protein phosphatase [Acetatifactor sp.]
MHCTEGKDRAGVVAALLECFMGASLDEVKRDYMVTFYNYYGIQPGDEQYEAILNDNIVTTLEKMFEVDELENAELSKEAEEYFRKIGLTDSQIRSLKNNLRENPYGGMVIYAIVLIGMMWIIFGIICYRRNREA